jgi:monofunctional biosynthetic peptidoglycan transglycosylase
MKIKALLLSLTSISAITGAWLSYLYFTLPEVLILRDCLKTSIHKIELCEKSPHYTTLENISPSVVEAFVLSEDTSFYQHNGFDWYEIKQSFLTNLERMRFARGGSTITQQLVKNAFLSSRKSLGRKFQEAILTHRVEEAFDKDFILEKYLNIVELGPNIYGIHQAARHYFSKHPRQLSMVQAVYLAHLLPNPRSYSEGFRKGELTNFSKKTMKNLLRRIYRFQRLSEEEFRTALRHVDHFRWEDSLPSEFEMDFAIDSKSRSNFKPDPESIPSTESNPDTSTESELEVGVETHTDLSEDAGS